jgi:hypothetical protein
MTQEKSIYPAQPSRNLRHSQGQPLQLPSNTSLSYPIHTILFPLLSDAHPYPCSLRRSQDKPPAKHHVMVTPGQRIRVRPSRKQKTHEGNPI